MTWALFPAWCRRVWPGRSDLPLAPLNYMDEEEWSTAANPNKVDPVAAIVRATNSHDNMLVQITYCPANGTAILTFIQPDETNEHREHQLRLTFANVRSFGIGSAGQATCRGSQVVSLKSEQIADGHDVEVILRDSGPIWAIKLQFGQLRYDRSPRRPWE